MAKKGKGKGKGKGKKGKGKGKKKAGAKGGEDLTKPLLITASALAPAQL